MGFHHLALATRDLKATHEFYTGAMGFELVKTEIVPKEDGFARHVFYSTGSDTDQLMAFWDLSNDPGASDFSSTASWRSSGAGNRSASARSNFSASFPLMV